MKILTLITSALAENSAGRATLNKVIEHSKIKEKHEIVEEILVGTPLPMVEQQIRDCDLLIIVASPFHFGIQAQAKEKFLELAESGCFIDKLTTFFLSSGGGGDQILERELELLFKGFGSKVINGYSCIDYAIFENQGKSALKTDRSGNNVDDMSSWLWSLTTTKADIIDVVKVLIVKATTDEEYFLKCREAITACYPQVEICDITTMNLNKCIGCKLCYTVKKQCIYNDRYFEVAEKLATYKKIFYIANFIGEGMSPLMDNLVQRHVSYGLYPSKPEPQHNIYFFKTYGASPEAVEAIRYKFKCLNSMEMNWYNIYFNNEYNNLIIDHEPIEVYDEEVKEIEEQVPESADGHEVVDEDGNIVTTTIVKRVIIKKKRIIESEEESLTNFEFDMAKTDYQIRKNAFPNVTGWTRMFVRHFARLANMIQNLLPIEYKFYRKHPMARFVEADQNIRPIIDPKGLKMAAKFKIATIEEFDTENYDVNKSGSLLSRLFLKH